MEKFHSEFYATRDVRVNQFFLINLDINLSTERFLISEKYNSENPYCIISMVQLTEFFFNLYFPPTAYVHG